MSKPEDCFINEVLAVVCWDAVHLTTRQMYCFGHRQHGHAKVVLLTKHKLAVHKIQQNTVALNQEWSSGALGCRHDTYA